MSDKRKATIYDLARIETHIKDCTQCPLASLNNPYDEYCLKFISNHTDEANEKILKWIDEHQQKTYMQDFLEKFPNAKLCDDEQRPALCRENIFGTRCSSNTCEKCWNEVMDDEDI